MPSYDDQRFFTRNMLTCGAEAGISIPGTAASDTELVRLRIPQAFTVDQATMVVTTGGTAAGPTVQVGKSVAGTGAVTSIASQAVGTAANNASFSFTVTSTDFDAGDHLVISNVAGTSASTPVAQIVIGFKETVVV